MASPVEDPSSMRDKKILDQVGNTIGQVCEIYEQDGDPMWVTIKSDTGMASDRLVFIPLARIKQEDGELRVPYSSQHINDSPEVESEDELSDDEEHALRAYYSVSIGDGELRTDNDSYAAQVPDSDAPSKKAEGSAGDGSDSGDREGSSGDREGSEGGAEGSEGGADEDSGRADS